MHRTRRVRAAATGGPRPGVAATAPASAILSVRDLHLTIAARRRCRPTPILRGVSLAVAPGEVHGLVGESGAGKTMFGRVILGIQPSAARIVRGSVVFDGRDVTHLGEAGRRRLMGRGLALIPQDPMTPLNPARQIGAQIADVLRLHLGMGPGRRPRPGAGAARRGPHPRPGPGAAPVSPRAVRRHAPARTHRHRLRLPPEARRRGRADDGARRDRATPGARPRQADAGAGGRVSPVRHPRPRRGRQDLRPRHGAARRAGAGDRRHAPDARSAAPTPTPGRSSPRRRATTVPASCRARCPRR